MMRFLSRSDKERPKEDIWENDVLNELADFCYREIEEIIEADDADLPDKVLLLKSLMDRFFTELIQNEPQYFSNPDSQISYLVMRQGLPEDIQKDISAFRKTARDLQAIQAHPNLSGWFPTAVWTVCESIRLFSRTPIPSALTARYSWSEQTVLPVIKPSPTAIEEARVVVRQIYHTHQGNPRLLVDHEEFGTITLFLNGIWSTLAPLTWLHATLFITHLEMVSPEKNSYRTSERTLLVLEPDFLVDASDIAECFLFNGTNPRISLLNTFPDKPVSYKMVLGILAGTLLSSLVSNPQARFSEVIDQALCAQRNLLLPLFLTGNIPELEDCLREDAEPHYASMQQAWTSLSPRSAQSETTFFSNRFGLSGRLDAYLQDTRQKDLKVFLELKSGSYPAKNMTISINRQPVPTGIWPNQLAQMACYRFLLKSTFPNQPGIAYVLYSKDPETPLRDAPEIEAFNARVMMLRNQIVAQHHRIVRGNHTDLKSINSRTFGLAPPFLTDQIEQFDQVVSSATDLERKYFFTYVTFISREHHTGKVGLSGRSYDRGFSALWQVEIPVKEKRYTAITGLELDLRESQSETGPLVFRRNETDRPANFRTGDLVVLYPLTDRKASKPLQDQIYQLTITSIDRHHLSLISRNRFFPYNEVIQQARHYQFAIEPDFWETTHKGQYQSLYRFLQAPPDRKALLLGTREPTFQQEPAPVSFSDPNNPEMHKTLERALKAQDYFLLQGPPGTGKTRLFLAHLVQSIIDHTDQNLLIVAFTNRSVDEIGLALQELPQPIDFLRLGNRIAESLIDTSLTKLFEDFPLAEVARRFSSTRVILSTVSSCLTHHTLLKTRTFHTAIVDEASQLLEPHLVGILSSVDRFFLIGDEKQLPAVVLQEERSLTVDDPDFQAISLSHLGTSLFERLVMRCQNKGWHDALGMLTRQGRMHQDIEKIPNELFYERKLRVVHDHQKTRAPYLARTPLSRGRVLFIPSRQERRTRVNTHEAVIIGHVLAMIRQNGLEPTEETIGIITPYRAQITEIQKVIPPDWKDLILVDTVERFQGSERDIIIVSFAVNHPNQLRTLQSLTLNKKVDRKLNVSLTRARQQLILTGCPELLNRGKYFRKMIDLIRQNNGYLPPSVFNPPE